MTRRVPPILLVIAAIGLYRASLLDRGAMAFLDETRYYSSALLLQHLGAGDVPAALREVTLNYARPGYAIVQAIPAAVQGIPFAFGVPPSNPSSLMIPAAFNVLVSLGTLYLLFRIALILFNHDRLLAMTAAVVYSLLVNTNVYIRHILPYDSSLLVGVYAVWLLLSREPTPARALWIGLLAGAVVAIYPGYYAMVGVLGVALMGISAGIDWRQRIRLAIAFAIGVLTLMAGVEVLYRLVGASYLPAARELSTTTRGSSADLLMRYLIEVERYAGVMLIVGAVAYLAQVAWRLAWRLPLRRIDWVVLPAVAMCLLQAATYHYWGRPALLGRVIHPWFVFFVLMLVDAIASLRRPAVRSALCAVAIGVALVSLARPALDYYRLAYPADVLYRLGIDTARLQPADMPCEMQPISTYTSPPPLNRETRYPYTTSVGYLLINFCQVIPGSGPIEHASVPAGATAIYRGPHFMTFPAYGFEGLTADERRTLAARGYDVQVYETGQRPIEPRR